MCCSCRAAEERNHPWVLRDRPPPTTKARSTLTEPQGEQRSDKGRQRHPGSSCHLAQSRSVPSDPNNCCGRGGESQAAAARAPKALGLEESACSGACLPDNLRIKRFFPYSIWKEHMLSDSHHSLQDSRKSTVENPARFLIQFFSLSPVLERRKSSSFIATSAISCDSY